MCTHMEIHCVGRDEFPQDSLVGRARSLGRADAPAAETKRMRLRVGLALRACRESAWPRWACTCSSGTRTRSVRTRGVGRLSQQAELDSNSDSGHLVAVLPDQFVIIGFLTSCRIRTYFVAVDWPS